jgi:hypothetical protein
MLTPIMSVATHGELKQPDDGTMIEPKMKHESFVNFGNHITQIRAC